MSPARAEERALPDPPARRKTSTYTRGQRIEMVAMDIDGTLLRRDKVISRAVLNTIRDCRDHGTRMLLASARPPRATKTLYELLELDTLQINYNGALIHCAVRNKHVYHQPVKAQLVQNICRLARRVDPNVVISIEILDKWYTDHIDDTLPTETSKLCTPDFIGPLDAFTHVPATKLMLLAPPDRLAPVEQAVRQKYEKTCRIVSADPHLIQISHRDAGKGVALRRVATDHYGVDMARTMAIGDAPNDVGMIRAAALGVAMGNAWSQVKDAADVIAPTNENDGVAWALRQFVLDA